MNNLKRPIIDPKKFILPPYITCPKCKKSNSFGVLMIGGQRYTRRCRECWFTESYKLPELNKKIIYLDQFAISDMMKAVNDKIGKKDKVDQFYFTLFEKLEYLSSAQLIVCPDSSFHRSESLLSDYSALKQMYEHFSGGGTFYDPATLHRFQIIEKYRAFLGNKKFIFDKEATGISSDYIHGWRPELMVSVDFKTTKKELKEMRESKLKIHQAIADVFNRWKTEKDKTIKDWFKEEGLAFGIVTINQFKDLLIKQSMYAIGQPTTIDEIVKLAISESNTLITSMINYIKSGTQEEKIKKVVSFLVSDEMLEIPFNKISALLWASIAHASAHGGQKTPPNQGTVNDIEMISTLLPYCDAILVDNAMFALLNNGEVKKEIFKYGTKIFSKNNKQEFFDYLDEVKKNANDDHFKKVTEIYGDNWGQPCWKMYH